MRRHGGGETGEIVAAFEHGDEAAVAVVGGELQQNAGQRGEVFVGERELAERVADAGVEAGGDHDEIGPESLQRGQQPLADRTANLLHAGAGGEG